MSDSTNGKGPLWWAIYDALDLSPDLRLDCTHDVFEALERRALTVSKERIEVMALEWEQDASSNWFAVTAFGQRYYIAGEFVVSFGGWVKTCSSLEGAKAAAQADFETRIRSALTAASPRTCRKGRSARCGQSGDDDPPARRKDILMGSVFTCKLNPCCGDRHNCNPPRQYYEDDAALASPLPVCDETAVEWCQPLKNGEHQPRQFIVYYEDASVGIAAFDNEADARQHWEQSNINWNCYLFGALPRLPLPAAAEPGVVEAATELVNYAWSAVVTDCTESAEYLNELVGNLRKALEAGRSSLSGEGAREVAWLIERQDNREYKQPHWYAEKENGWHWWTPIAHTALRFASKAEAEAFPPYQMIASNSEISITEHVFLGQEP